MIFSYNLKKKRNLLQNYFLAHSFIPKSPQWNHQS